MLGVWESIPSSCPSVTLTHEKWVPKIFQPPLQGIFGTWIQGGCNAHDQSPLNALWYWQLGQGQQPPYLEAAGHMTMRTLLTLVLRPPREGQMAPVEHKPPPTDTTCPLFWAEDPGSPAEQLGGEGEAGQDGWQVAAGDGKNPSTLPNTPHPQPLFHCPIGLHL